MQAIKDWFYSKKAYLFDLDGTLYLGSKKLPGAKALVERLRSDGKELFFFTNNSSRSAREYVQKLKRMGFAAKLPEVVMSTHSLIRHLKSKKIADVFLLGTPAMRRMLQAEGVHHRLRRAKAVVVGFDKSLDYSKLDIATKLLDQGMPLIVTHPDLFCPTEKGPEPDCGAIAKLLEFSSGRKASITLGKPHPSMIKIVRERTEVSKNELVVIGDRLNTDIAMASGSGLDSLLVLSGDSSRSELKTSSVQPTYVAKSVAELL